MKDEKAEVLIDEKLEEIRRKSGEIRRETDEVVKQEGDSEDGGTARGIVLERC